MRALNYNALNNPLKVFDCIAVFNGILYIIHLLVLNSRICIGNIIFGNIASSGYMRIVGVFPSSWYSAFTRALFDKTFLVNFQRKRKPNRGLN